jgi:hypothetical protein
MFLWRDPDDTNYSHEKNDNKSRNCGKKKKHSRLEKNIPNHNFHLLVRED